MSEGNVFVPATPRQEPSSSPFPHAPAPSRARSSRPSPTPRRDTTKGAGVEANARLTGATAAVLLVLLAIEGVTVLRVRELLTLHVFVGMLLIPPVVVKLASTTWRFARYYLGAADYRRKGPPRATLRVLGPFVAVLSVVLLASGVLTLIGPHALRGPFLQLHQASFVAWFAVMTIHVLGHLGETARLAGADWSRRTRRYVAGSRARRRVLTASLVLGVLLALITVPHVGTWFQGA